MFYRLLRLETLLLLTVFLGGCAVEAAKKQTAETSEIHVEKNNNPKKNAETENASKGASIVIEKNSPADTVRAFYKNLREKRFREAMFLTNLRPAIEGLTDAELKDLQIDFDPIAQRVPIEIEINGEIISGDAATVTAKLPDNETGEIGLQQIKLRKANNCWTILTVDPSAEKAIAKEGRNYFFALRIETHHSEAREMLGRISKAQMVFAVQNNGLYAEISALIEKGFLPPDVLSSASTGYNYAVSLSPDKKSYAASAVPAAYGKTGKLTFHFEFDGKNKPRLIEKDNGGGLLKK